jgi:hypothetical protein
MKDRSLNRSELDQDGLSAQGTSKTESGDQRPAEHHLGEALGSNRVG